MSRWALTFLAVIYMAIGAIGPVFADVDLSRMAVTPNPRLGLAFPGSQTRYYRAIAEAGIGVTRLSASWKRIEASPGKTDFRGLDERVKALQDLGIQPFLTFESDADWATDPATHGVKNAQPLDLAQWSRFVRKVVSRYNGDGKADMPGLRFPVRYYQVANEWISDSNRSGGWGGSTDDLIAYINTAHDAVAQEDPDAIFVLGGIASFNSDVLLVSLDGQDMEVRQTWGNKTETVMKRRDIMQPDISAIINKRVLPVLSRAEFDIASVHLYGPETRDAARLKLVQRLTGGKPVLSTECGGPTLDYGGRYTPEGHFRAVIHRNLNVLAANAPFCLWFRLGEGPGATYGNSRTALYEGPGKPKPGVYAYRLLSRLIDNGTHVIREGDRQFSIVRGDGQTVEIAWGPAAATLRAKGAAAGINVLCLSDPKGGILASEPTHCDKDAMTFTGTGLTALLNGLR